MMCGELPYPPMNETTNMALLEVGNGRVRCSGRYRYTRVLPASI